MARIELDELAHTYDPLSRPVTSRSAQSQAPATPPLQWALRPLALSCDDGGAYALLGPSGCGKTTLLNCISGLLTPTRGRVSFDGRDVTALPPQQRNIAQVFQFPVIYDTLSVFDNLAFPLRNRRWAAPEVRRRVHEIAEILELQPLLTRRASGLSADVKQKISLGRGLVRPDVAAVLFDEPLTVIDPQIKWLLRRKLKLIHQQLSLTLIYVTHDQTEALTFADQVVVMSGGEVVQIGTPEELFEAPAHRFVGHFIGAPGMNFLACDWQGGASIAGVPLATTSSTVPGARTALLLGIRPEYVEIHATPGPNRIPVQVTAVQDHGTHRMVRVAVGNDSAWSRSALHRQSAAQVQPGPAFAYLPAEKCALYQDERRIA
jgi:glycerol transport system ATP-binding protein